MKRMSHERTFKLVPDFNPTANSVLLQINSIKIKNLCPMDHGISDLHVFIFHFFCTLFFFLGYTFLGFDYLASFKVLSWTPLIWERIILANSVPLLYFYYFSYLILIIYIHSSCPLMFEFIVIINLCHSSLHPQHLAQCLISSRL